MRALFAISGLALLASGCQAGPHGPVRQVVEAPHPRGILASSPPADSSYSPLRCWQDGPETICKRSD